MQDMKITDQKWRQGQGMKWNAKSILSLFCLKRLPLVCSFVSCYFIPAFSCPAISCPAHNSTLVRQFHVRHFHVQHFQRPRKLNHRLQISSGPISPHYAALRLSIVFNVKPPSRHSARGEQWTQTAPLSSWSHMQGLIDDETVGLTDGRTERLWPRSLIIGLLHCVSEKTRKLWNGIAQNYKDRFWWHLAKIFKIL